MHEVFWVNELIELLSSTVNIFRVPCSPHLYIPYCGCYLALDGICAIFKRLIRPHAPILGLDGLSSPIIGTPGHPGT